MGYMAYILAVAANAACALKKKNHKGVILITIIFLFAVLAFNTGNADYDNYLFHFDEYRNGLPLQSRVEIGFQIFLYSCARIFQDYGQFLFFVSAIFTLFFIFMLKSLQGYANLHLFLCLFLFYPLFANAVQVRYALGMAIFFCAAACYWKNGSNWKFLLGIVIAGMFHITFFIFIPFALLLMIRKLGLGFWSVCYGFFFVISLVFLFARPSGFFARAIDVVLSFAGSRYQYFWDDLQKPAYWYSYVLVLSVLLINTLCNYISVRCVSRQEGMGRADVLRADFLLKLNYYCCFFLPAILITPQSERIFRAAWVGNSVLYAICISHMGKNRVPFLLVALAVGILNMFVFVLLSSPTLEGCFRAMLEQNILFR